jgi:hypothetical protein
MSRNTLLKLFLLAFIFAFSFESSLACMYGPPYRTVCETYAQADSVIIGKVESIKGDSSIQIVVINVEKTFKGQNQKRIVVSQPQSSCDWDFSDEEGETLLLYLARNRKTQKYSAIAEGMGGRVEKQSENLYWLNNLPKSRNRTRLSGEIRLYQDEPFEFINSVAGLKVRIFNSKKTFEVSTNKNGVYEIWDIPVGKYQIEPIIPPNLKLSFDLERGLIDFDSLKKKNPNTNAVLVEIQPKGCGGIDFIVNEKPDK